MKSLSTWSLTGRLLVAVILVLLAVVVLPELVPNASTGKRVSEWILTHRDSLPSTLDELGQIPPEYRAQVVSALAPDVKYRLWQTQLTELLRDARLTAVQRQFVTGLRARLTPATYGTRRTVSQVSEDRGVCARIDATFQLDDHRKALRELGYTRVGWTATFGNWALVRLHFSGWIRSALTAQADGPVCNCDENQSPCEKCKGWGGGRGSCPCSVCSEYPQNCGCAGNVECRGFCEKAPIGE